jgi:hypothetical protein
LKVSKYGASSGKGPEINRLGYAATAFGIDEAAGVDAVIARRRLPARPLYVRFRFHRRGRVALAAVAARS